MIPRQGSRLRPRIGKDHGRMSPQTFQHLLERRLGFRMMGEVVGENADRRDVARSILVMAGLIPGMTTESLAR